MGKEEKERKTNSDLGEFYICLTGTPSRDLDRNPSVCPDQESNQ